MSINKVRSWLYWSSKILGDVQAGSKSVRTKSPRPVLLRVARRLAGKMTGRLLGRIR